MRRVLITGYAGFLGSYFTRAHLEAGDMVFGVDDWSASRFADMMEYRKWLSGSKATFNGELNGWRHTLPVDLGKVFNFDFDLACHFAAPVGGRMKIDGDPLFNAHSLAIDEAFFRWATQHCPKVVYPSSSAVYGTYLQHNRLAEALTEREFQPQVEEWFSPDQMYGFTKLAGEYLAWKAADYGVDTLCIRPFSGYGEGQSFDYPVPSIARRALQKEDPLIIWGSGEQTRDFIHVEDLVNITLARMERVDGYQTLNIGSGVPTSFRQVAELCAEIVGYAPTIKTDSSKPEGVFRRYANIRRQKRFFNKPLIDLREGLTRVLADVEQRTK